MVDFIRMVLLELRGSRVERELQNVKFLPTVGFEPELIIVHLVFTCAIFINLPVALGRCSKIIFRELHFVNSLLSAKFLIGKKQNDTNIR